VQGVGSSNLPAPTKKIKDLRKAASCGFFVFGDWVRKKLSL
jgi:hypothetical protein